MRTLMKIIMIRILIKKTGCTKAEAKRHLKAQQYGRTKTVDEAMEKISWAEARIQDERIAHP